MRNAVTGMKNGSASGTITRSRSACEASSPDTIETARYIAAMSAELSVMARHARLDLLSYFLDMARMEANAQSRAARETQRER